MTTKAYLVQFLYHSAFISVVSTWTKAIDDGYFTTWPILTSKLLHKHLPKSLAIARGHLEQSKQNVWSAKIVAPPSPPLVPDTSKLQVQSHQVFIKSIQINENFSSYQTGHFPVFSICGSKYLMVIFDHDSNTILAETLKSRNAQELVRSYEALHEKLCS